MEPDKNEIEELKAQVRQQTVGYVTAALGLVAGLAWNEAVKDMIDAFFPVSKNSLSIKFLYAIGITAVVILISIYLNKLAGHKK